MASLQGTKIKDTFKSLLKVNDNGELEVTGQEITDGIGNGTGVSLNTSGDVTATGTVAFGSLKDSGENITITKFVDEADGIASNDNDSSIPTSAAVRDYVDNNITAQDLDISDGTNSGSVDLGSQSLLFTGDAGVSATVSGQEVTFDSSALQSQITSNDGDISSLDGRLETAENKLSTVESGADVTDVANVTAALNSISVTELNDVTNAGSGAIITTAERNKLAGIEAGAEVNTVDSVNTQTGAVVLDADDIDDSATTNKFTTQAETDKLAGIESGAQVNTVDSVNGETGAVVIDADDIDDTSTTNKFVTATDVTKLSNITITQAVDLDTLESDVAANTSKLAGIENGADVTDATNVAASGAMMTDIALLNDLADVSGTPTDGQVLTYDTVNGWQPETAASSPIDSVNGQTGVVVLDADDISDATTTNKFTTQSDIDKLAGIESGAQVNVVDSVNSQTGDVVLDPDDLNDTATVNKFTTQAEIDKLAGIEPLADVTDVSNVTSALTSISVTAHSDVTSAGSGDIITTAERSKLTGIEAGAQVNTVDSVNTQTGAVVLDADDISDAATTNKFTTAGDISKLAGIEAGADVTDVDNVTTALGSISVTAHSDVTNAGSGQIITSAERTQLQGADAKYTVSVISTSTTAVKDFAYILTADLTLTLPASPSAGDKVAVSNMSGTTTPVVARNGENIAGLAEDLTIDVDNLGIQLVYTGATKGWVLL